MRALLILALVFLSPSSDHAREFDFWIGEWNVLNRHMDTEGNWSDGDRTRARITPVLDGAAILEEWAGPFGQSFMNGFSLRAWNPEREKWSLLLFWTTDGNATFGQLHGEFRHGRGEFFAPESGPRQTRYSFSDGLAESVRWDSATTKDGGVNWSTDWIMEFSRTKPAQEVDADLLFGTHWTEGDISPHAEARELDWLVGEWSGSFEGTKGEKREARLRCKLLSKGCLILDVLETRAEESEDWHGELSIRGYVSRSKRWEGWSLSEADTVLRPHAVELAKRGATCTQTNADRTELTRNYTLDEAGVLSIEVTSGGKRVSVTKLTRRGD